MAKFKKGSDVLIVYPNGRERVGKVVALVNKRQLPNNKFKFSKRPKGNGRGHISYVVETDNRHYWPKVGYVRKAAA